MKLFEIVQSDFQDTFMKDKMVHVREIQSQNIVLRQVTPLRAWRWIRENHNKGFEGFTPKFMCVA